MDTEPSIPAIVIGGVANALSVARNLARCGVKVLTINYPHEPVRFSRYAHHINLGSRATPSSWARFLLSRESDYLRGSVLLTCSDEAISMLIDNHAALANKFRLEEGEPEVRRDLLDKFKTYRLAEAAGIPTVAYRLIRSRKDLEQAMSALSLPLIMKPVYSPNAARLRSKAILISDNATLERQCETARALGIDVVLMEYIPGGDDRLCSYYTYLDDRGEPLVHLTKRQPRRYPRNSGGATYHITQWIPEVADLGLRFFRHLNFRGLGNIEFKWDERDRKLKLIEVNARYTASDCLLTKSGVNLALIAYNRIVGKPQSPSLQYQESLVLWCPIADITAAWQLYRRGELRLVDWISQLRHVDKLPLFEWRDPLPSVRVMCRHAWRGAQRLPRFARDSMFRTLGTAG